MDKKQSLADLRHAKSAHLQWRANIQALVIDVFVAPKLLPLIHTDSPFGQWYYGSGQMISSLKSYPTIGLLNEELHRVYMELFKLYNTELEASSFFNSKAKIKLKRQVEIERLGQKIMVISKNLMEACNHIERELIQMTDEQSAQIY